MAKGSGPNFSGTLIGIIAIVAGILVLTGMLPLYLIIGIFLIVYGILAIIRR